MYVSPSFPYEPNVGFTALCSDEQVHAYIPPPLATACYPDDINSIGLGLVGILGI